MLCSYLVDYSNLNKLHWSSLPKVHQDFYEIFLANQNTVDVHQTHYDNLQY